MLVYFVGGQLLLILFVRIYITASGVDVLAELAKDYEQDGQQFGGNAPQASPLVLMSSHLASCCSLAVVTGETTMELAGLRSLRTYRSDLATGLASIYRQDHAHQADLHKEIYEDRNVNAALIEGISVNAVAISFSLFCKAFFTTVAS